MAEPEEILTSTIDDYILSIASGLTQAQKELNTLASREVPYGESIRYMIPHIDFELKMSVELATSPELDKKYPQKWKPPAWGPKHVLMKPVNPGNADQMNTQALSTISGRIVSVPQTEGKPVNQIAAALKKLGDRKVQISTTVISPGGKGVQGAEIHCNIDREESQELNKNRALQAGTDIEEGVQITNENGETIHELLIANNEPRNTKIALVLDFEWQSELIIYDFS